MEERVNSDISIKLLLPSKFPQKKTKFESCTWVKTSTLRLFPVSSTCLTLCLETKLWTDPN